MDIFAIVLDFWNTEKETYDTDTGRPFPCTPTAPANLPLPHSPYPSFCFAVKLKICRESYSDYEVAADLINKEYDIAMLNFKLGQPLPATQLLPPDLFLWASERRYFDQLAETGSSY